MRNDNCDDRLPHWLKPDSQPPALRIAAVVSFAIVAALVAARIHGVLHVPPADPEFNSGLTDFHATGYFPQLGFRHGYNPYSREYAERYSATQLPIYSPAIFWLLQPFSLLPLEAANVVYYLFSCSLVVALAASALAVCRLPLTVVNTFGLSTFILLSRPGYANVLGGQITLLPVLGAVWALELSRRRPTLGGFALALTTLKPNFAIPIIWLMACRRDFRTVIAGVLIGGIAALIGFVPLIANHGLRPVIESIVQGQQRLGVDKTVAPDTTWTRIDAVALVGKLTGSEPDQVTQLAILATCLLAAGLALWKIGNTSLAEGADGLSGLIICTATLACVYHANYSALLLVVPWLGATFGRLRTQLPAALSPVVWLLLTIPAVNYFSARMITRWLSIDGPLWTALTMLNSICIAAALIIAISAAVRAPGHRAPASSVQSGDG